MNIVKQNRRGFTLVEIMIVVLIIGLLLAIAVPNFMISRQRGRVASVIYNLREIETAKDQYVLANALGPVDPVNDASALVPAFIHQWPSGPVIGVYAANAVNNLPTFEGHDEYWFLQHCQGANADSSCPL